MGLTFCSYVLCAKSVKETFDTTNFRIFLNDKLISLLLWGNSAVGIYQLLKCACFVSCFKLKVIRWRRVLWPPPPQSYLS